MKLNSLFTVHTKTFKQKVSKNSYMIYIYWEVNLRTQERPLVSGYRPRGRYTKWRPRWDNSCFYLLLVNVVDAPEIAKLNFH